MRILETRGFLHRLYPLAESHRKKYPKSPKLYFRDGSLLLKYLGFNDVQKIVNSPMKHRILGGHCIEHVICQESLLNPGSRFYYCGGYTDTHIDLVIDRPGFTTGLIFR